MARAAHRAALVFVRVPTCWRLLERLKRRCLAILHFQYLRRNEKRFIVKIRATRLGFGSITAADYRNWRVGCMMCIKSLAIDDYALIMHYGCINKPPKASGENISAGSGASDHHAAKASASTGTRWSSRNTIERFPRSRGAGDRKASRFL